MRIENETDLLAYYGAQTVAQFKKAIFKYTDCGAWAEVFPAHEEYDGTLVEAGVSFGSIVEGVEETTQVYTVYFPCDSDDLDKALDQVEEEAEEIWNNTHGCECCWQGGIIADEWGNVIGPTDFGMRPIDPDCPECEGNGIII